MCGLAGFFSYLGPEQTRKTLARMLHVQSHRGPDSTGIWCDALSGIDVSLGLSRLKILDLSDAANQPMVSEDGRYILVYNGELYNYVEIRAELAASGVLFRTQGDTEVVLQALIVWGPAAFARFNGMWALVLVDRVSGEVMFSRDRFGIKPLYTYTDERGLYVSSEIKAILDATRKRFQVSLSAADAFLNQNLLCINRTTFFAGIEEFPAGNWAVVPVNEIGKRPLDPCRYWAISKTPANHSSECALIDAVRESFIDSVKLRLRSDVPVGVLLSGGTDSSAIAAVLHFLNPSRQDIKLISAVAANGNDEQPFIDTVANYVKRPVEKVVLNYPASRALDLISEVSWFNDEPIYNFSIVAHYLLMQRARDLGIIVLLSGQGADEILCGYKKYLGFYLQELLVSGKWLTAAQVTRTFLEKGTVFPQITYREAKRYLPRWLYFPEIDIRGPALIDAGEWIHVGLNGGGVIGRQIADLEQFSVPGIVHYEDRMSMAVGREIRLPFLDYRFVNLVVPLPVEYKLQAGWTKWIFRQAMEPLLPKEIAWRTDKQNFIVPQNDWFRSELRKDVLKLLEGEWLTEQLGLISRQKFRARYDAYLRQPANNGRLSFKDIFSPIALELWARRFEEYLSP
jgi:asparagine synthase (glutamine-hydrolysing)